MNKITTKRSWLAVLFGLIFFIVGIGILTFMIAPIVYDGWRMQSWKSVPAVLLSADLKRNYSSDSDTYQAIARYKYTVNGQQYVNDRVALVKGADNIGDFQTSMGNRLKYYFQSGQLIGVWYNPENPAESIIHRSIRWGLLAFQMIFVVVFGGFGFVILYFSFRGEKAKSPIATENHPWLARAEWKNGAIKSNAKMGMMVLWGITLFWNVISFPAAIAATPEVLAKGEYIGFVIFLFPLIGLGLLFWAIKATLQWRRFGVTLLTMEPYPGSLGGQVGGFVKINMQYDATLAYKVTLSCINSYISGSGKNRSRKESVKWQDEGYARIKPMMDHLNLEFCFDVPDNLPASEEASNNYHLWRLTTESEMEGVDLNRSFEIPVYNTQQQSSRLNFKSPEFFPASVEKITAESLLPLTKNSNVKELYYPMLRKPLGSFSGVLFGGIFAGIGFFLWQQAKTDGFMLYVMSSVFTPIGLIIVIAGIYSAFNSLYLKFDGLSLLYRRKFLWFTLVNKAIPYSDIRVIEARKSSSGNTGGKHKIGYKVYAKVKGKKYTLVESIDSASKKDLLIEYFKQEISRHNSRY
ncbi:hypothetical protein MNBD_GAMMA23-1480 [hydrothermal vent metagenome]|uniref:DUF3592 domain-containing protein n=1 Tax=hydrothermal vent metagenome TaxID=652676 RepID=A0A3B1AGQ8_9ZZZZ